MRYVGEQRSERHDELHAEVAREPDDELGERPPAVVRLDPEQDHGVALGAGDAGVEERVLGPLDVACQPFVERHRRTHGLEVHERLGVDVREPLRTPLTREVRGGDRRRLPAVVPATERRDEHGLAKRRALGDPEILWGHGNSVTAVSPSAPAGGSGRQPRPRARRASTAAARACARPRRSAPRSPLPSVTCTSTSPQGSAFRYWTSPTSICARRTREQHAGEPHDSRRLAPGAKQLPADEQEADPEHRGRAHVDVHGVADLQPEPVDRIVRAGMGPRRGRDRARDDHHGARRDADDRHQPQPTRSDRMTRGRPRGSTPRSRRRPRARRRRARAGSATSRRAGGGRGSPSGRRAGSARWCRGTRRAPRRRPSAAGRRPATRRARSPVSRRSRRARSRGSRTRPSHGSPARETACRRNAASCRSRAPTRSGGRTPPKRRRDRARRRSRRQAEGSAGPRPAPPRRARQRHASETPLPDSTRPTAWSSSPAPAKVASRTARFSAGSVTSSPPAVCGS